MNPMNPDQVSFLLALAVANFPTLQEKDMGPTLVLWQEMLSDIPFEVAKAAIKKVLATIKYFPTVAEIREACSQITNPRQLTYDEAWALIIGAISRYGYYREAEGLTSLPLIVQQVVKNIGWQEVCTCEEPDVIRGQFRRAWEVRLAREREENMLPAEIRLIINKAAAGVKRLPEEVS